LISFFEGKKTLVTLKLSGVFYKNIVTWGLNYFMNMPNHKQNNNTSKLCDLVVGQRDLFKEVKEDLKGDGYDYFN